MDAMSHSISNQSTSTAMTQEAIDAYLDQLQDEDFKVRIPAVIFLVVLAVTGLCGNILVLAVYCSRSNKKPTRILIMAMAVYDLIANVLTIPGFIHNLLHTMRYPSVSMCRAMISVAAFTTISSMTVLLALSVTRYRLVCRPFGWQVTAKQAKIISGCIAIFCFVISVPSGLTGGLSHRATPLPDIHGLGCAIDHNLADTPWPSIVNIFYFFLFLGMCIPLVSMYCMIGVQAYKHRHFHGRSSVKIKTSSASGSLSQRSEENTLERPSKRKMSGCLKSSSRYDMPRKASVHSSRGHEKVKYVNHDHRSHPEIKEEKGVKLIQTSALVAMAPCSVPMVTGYSPDVVEIETRASSSGVQVSCSSLSSSSNNGVEKSEMFGVSDITIPAGGDSCTENSHQSSGCRATAESAKEYLDVQSETTPVKDRGTEEAFQQDLVTRLELFVMNSVDENRLAVKWNLNNDESSCSLSKMSSLATDSCKVKKHTMDARKPRKTEEVKRINYESDDGFSDDNTAAVRSLPIQTTATETTAASRGTALNCFSAPLRDRLNSNPPRSKSRMRTAAINRTTVMLLVITSVYLAAFLPFFFLSVYRQAFPAHFDAMGAVAASVFHVFMHGIFVNNATNFIIYSLCDPSFRHDVSRLFSRTKA